MNTYIIIRLVGNEIGEIEAVFLSHESAIAHLKSFLGDGYELQTRHAGETYPYSQEIVYDTSRNGVNYLKQPTIYTESWQIIEIEAKD